MKTELLKGFLNNLEYEVLVMSEAHTKEELKEMYTDTSEMDSTNETTGAIDLKNWKLNAAMDLKDRIKVTDLKELERIIFRENDYSFRKVCIFLGQSTIDDLGYAKQVEKDGSVIIERKDIDIQRFRSGDIMGTMNLDRNDFRNYSSLELGFEDVTPTNMFNHIVNENTERFGMTPRKAIVDAVQTTWDRFNIIKLITKIK